MDRLSVIEDDLKNIKEEQAHIKSIIYLLRGQINYLLSKIIQYESGSDSSDSDSDYSTDSDELFNYLDDIDEISP